MSPTSTCCYICNDDMPAVFYVAEFEGDQKQVCIDCADGISDGLAILKQLNITGETPDK